MSFALLGYPRSRKNGGHSAFRVRSLDLLPYLWIGALRRYGLCRLRLAVVHHLLPDGEDVVDQPVDDEPGREAPEHEGEDDGHEQHHLLLRRLHPVSYTHLRAHETRHA